MSANCSQSLSFVSATPWQTLIVNADKCNWPLAVSQSLSQSASQSFRQYVNHCAAAGKRVSPKYAKYLSWPCLQISYTLGCIWLTDQLWRISRSVPKPTGLHCNYEQAIEQVCIWSLGSISWSIACLIVISHTTSAWRNIRLHSGDMYSE